MSGDLKATIRQKILEIVSERFLIAAPGLSEQIRMHSANAAADRIIRALAAAIPAGCLPMLIEAVERREQEIRKAVGSVYHGEPGEPCADDWLVLADTLKGMRL